MAIAAASEGERDFERSTNHDRHANREAARTTHPPHPGSLEVAGRRLCVDLMPLHVHHQHVQRQAAFVVAIDHLSVEWETCL